ncbi:HNH endonuclease [Mycobacterium tuberculosis]|nr:HNH endonuclease [Mycobacterium tuberculosis]
MAKEKRHESEDLEDYEVLDSGDTLDGPPGDDPLDRGVVPPQRWSTGIKYSTTTSGREEDDSLDRLSAAEEPDVTDEFDDDEGEFPWDENATEAEILRYADEDLADPRAGRLVPASTDVYEEEDTYLAVRDELAARDEGIDGGGASAEEAAVHVVDDDSGEAEDSMIRWEQVQRDDVVHAIQEYDRLGPDSFFAEHGFGPATTYELVWEDRHYPPKAILGTAYEMATGHRLASGDFEGGKSGAVKVLGKLDFDVQPQHHDK